MEEKVMEKRLYRSKCDKMVSGVCGGIAEYFEVDSTMVRLLCVISIFALGTGILLYILASIIIPERTDIESVLNLNEEKNTKFLGYSFILIGLILFIKRFPVFHWINFKLLFPILIIGLGVVVLGKSFKK
jgi:phage shock protein C